MLAPLLLAALPVMQDVDLLVRNGSAVTLDAQRRILADAAVAISGGRIVAVGPQAELAARIHARETLDAGGGIILPGLINAHTHAPMVLFRGLADDLKLMDWLQNDIFPAEARNVDADFVKAGTRLAALEMIRSGTTTFVDMYYFEDQVAEAAKDAGLRTVAGETWIDFPAPDNKTHAEAVAYSERYLKRWTGDPLVVPALAPHSPYLCAPESIREARALADRYRAPILIHVSEAQDEVRQVREKYGKTSTEHLRDLGLLRKGVLFAHGIWLSASDRALVRASDVGVAHCPQSNMKLGSGVAPVPKLLKAGVRVGLGTDGPSSNNDLDLLEEVDSALKLQKLTGGDPAALTAREAVEMATLGGARALDLEDRIGSLAPGKRADLIVVALDQPHALPLYDAYSALAYALKGSDVETTIVDGRILMRDRKLLTLDVAAIAAKAREYGEQVARSLSQP